MPEVAPPNWAKDDFNDFSTHHHSIVLSGTRSKFHENASPSEREAIVDAREIGGSVGKREWILWVVWESVCSSHVPGIAGIDDQLQLIVVLYFG